MVIWMRILVSEGRLLGLTAVSELKLLKFVPKGSANLIDDAAKGEEEYFGLVEMM